MTTEYRIPVNNNSLWQPPVIDITYGFVPPPSPNRGDRYISNEADWSGNIGAIHTWNGSAWEDMLPSPGTMVYVNNLKAYFVFQYSAYWATMGHPYRWFPFGNGNANVMYVGADYTAQSWDYIIRCVGGGCDITLPDPSFVNDFAPYPVSKTYIIHNDSTGTMTIKNYDGSILWQTSTSGDSFQIYARLGSSTWEWALLIPQGGGGGGLDVYQFTQASLANGATWSITHNVDPNFKRMVDVWRTVITTDGTLDYDEADAGLFTQEDITKTLFVGGEVQLKDSGAGFCYAHWMMNESGGTNVPDTSGHSRSGTTVNSPTWVAGKLNNCLQFLATSSQMVDCGDIAHFERNQPFSIEFWTYPALNPTRQALVGNLGGSPNYRGWNVEWVYYTTNIAKVQVVLESTPSNYIQVTSQTNYYINAWHHVVITYNGSSLASGITIYVDGVVSLKNVLKDTLTTTMVDTAHLYIARGAGTMNYYTGKMDEVVVYDRELTPAQVAYRYNSGTGRETILAYDNTKGWYVSTNTNQLNTLLWADIQSIAFDETTPASTQVRYLVSFDGRATWKAHSGGSWSTVALGNIDTQGNSKAQLEALVKADWDLIFTPGTFDIVSSLKTTDVEQTPQLSQVILTYDLMGAQKCKDSEITITAHDSTTTTITNISGATLESLRAQILI